MSDAVTPGAPAREYRSLWTALMRVPFRQDWIDAGGISTRYAEAGDPSKPALIMLHGTAGSWECFAPNLGAHAEHFRCLALDMVGSGFSDKPDHDYEITTYGDHVRAFMAAKGVKRAHFIGVSLGAWVAARLAVDHPECVDKLVLLAPTGLIANAETMGDIKGRRTAAVEDPNWDRIKGIFNGLIYDEANRIPDLVAVRQAVYRLPEMKQAMLHVLCLQEPDIRPRNLIAEDEWGRIKAPTLLIGAPDDKADYYETALKLGGVIPDAHVVEIRRVKHWGQFEEPEVFNAASLDFLKSA